ncbi:MAG TPA: DUF6481 family protein [Allosphingosinicella sp.]|nr:DUF6481 family protein [Allosphingosinicella sp.]
MRAYQGPSYQDRVGRAAEAKQKALDRLKGRPAVDEATLAVRREAGAAREAAQAERRAARQAERDEGAAHRAARADEAAVRAEENEGGRIPTEEERKAMRDARYAARKSRK